MTNSSPPVERSTLQSAQQSADTEMMDAKADSNGKVQNQLATGNECSLRQNDLEQLSSGTRSWFVWCNNNTLYLNCSCQQSQDNDHFLQFSSQLQIAHQFDFRNPASHSALQRSASAHAKLLFVEGNKDRNIKLCILKLDLSLLLGTCLNNWSEVLTFGLSARAPGIAVSLVRAWNPCFCRQLPYKLIGGSILWT